MSDPTSGGAGPIIIRRQAPVTILRAIAASDDAGLDPSEQADLRQAANAVEAGGRPNFFARMRTLRLLHRFLFP